MKYYVGAYATSPCSNGWNAALETAFYHALKKDKRIKGLEHPFLGSLHAEDDAWFLANIDPAWDYVFTCVPGIMAAIGQNPAFGLASQDEVGRKEALAFMQKARKAIVKLNAHCQRQVVRAIHIQTAPNQTQAAASVAAFKASLSELQSWDWQGAKIIIEHCDAPVEGQLPAKGFLTLAQEIEAISEVNAALNCAMGITINWGRSVIETRTVEGPLMHIEQALQAGILSGLMFSGASGAETEYGSWKDSHQPHAQEGGYSAGEKDSLMTASQMHQCLRAANYKTLEVVGVKLGIRPKQASLSDRLECIKEALNILDEQDNH